MLETITYGGGELAGQKKAWTSSELSRIMTRLEYVGTSQPSPTQLRAARRRAAEAILDKLKSVPGSSLERVLENLRNPDWRLVDKNTEAVSQIKRSETVARIVEIYLRLMEKSASEVPPKIILLCINRLMELDPSLNYKSATVLLVDCIVGAGEKFKPKKRTN